MAACPYTRAIDRSSHAGYRSILVLTSLAYTRSGQSERRVPSAPIRMPERSSRLSGQRRIPVTQPRVTPEHERQLVTSFRSACHRAILIWGSRHGRVTYPGRRRGALATLTNIICFLPLSGLNEGTRSLWCFEECTQ